MSNTSADGEVVVIGAGAAGIGAAKVLRQHGVPHRVVEASHRIGGRAYTEDLTPDIRCDLGCHWLHSASINPFTHVADAYGMRYRRKPVTFEELDGHGGALPEVDGGFDAFNAACLARMADAVAAGRDDAAYAFIDRDSPYAAFMDWWVSLMTSKDPDEVSAADLVNYHDTGENWPLEAGYGTLVARFGADVPVTLNCAVDSVDWSGRRVRVDTRRGVLEADAVIVAVSTGVLGNGDLSFTPSLPDWKQAAIADLPLGANNCIGIAVEAGSVGRDYPSFVTVAPANDVPMSLRIRPFGQDCVRAYTGGRHAAWLERAGQQATVDLVTERLVAALGSSIRRHLGRAIVSAWTEDPFVRGSYSASRPGRFAARAELARPIDARIYFAGEATSSEFFSTCHGAYLTGRAAAEAVASALRAN